MKTKVFDSNGKVGKEISLPKCFGSKIREDIVHKVLEAKRKTQPYSPSPVAGMQQSDRGKIRHRRHVWQTHYGRGMSRVPRKVMSRRGTQFNWEASGVPQAKGGPRTHPPKVIAMVNSKKINKKELITALNSAISATANSKFLVKKYSKLEEKDVKNLPLVVESKFIEKGTKNMLNKIKEMLGESLFGVAIQKKTQRAGKGKIRGRKYKSNAGMIFVLGEKEKLKTTMFDVTNVENLGVEDLARGGLGRLTVYSESAIKELEKRK